MDAKQTRPTKKQYELLLFIEKFVSQHGYGPSYREIMKGCGYNSVATVALHVNNLISRGHLQKKGRLARSLEVVKLSATTTKVQTNIINPSEEKWLIEKIDYQFQQLEGSNTRTQDDVDKLYVLVGALRVLGLDGAAQSFLARLQTLKKDVY